MFRVALPFLLAAATSAAQPATRESMALPSLATLVESVKGTVVNVDVKARAKGSSEDMGDELFEHFFGRPRRRDPIRPGAGSGFIIDKKGLILTNNHVVENAVAIRVKLDDGRTFDAKVLGRDPLTDVALLKLSGKVDDLPVAKLGDSNALRVGDWVVAIGNPFGLASSVSVGIVSAKARDIGASRYDEFIQTDAAINPGNSGGPLFNMSGEVVGINTAIIGIGTGIGFAVPSNLAKALVPQLEKHGEVTRGWLGIGIQDLTAEIAKGLNVPATQGAVITLVNPGSPAQKAGLQVDDVVVAVDGEKVASGGALSRTIALKRPDSTVTLSLFRRDKPMELKAKLGTRPPMPGDPVSAPAREAERPAGQQRFGVVVQDMDARMAQAHGLPSSGALVTEVQPGTPAERADLQSGMVIVEADGKPVRNADELTRILKSAKSGSTLLLRIVGPAGARGLRALQVP